MKPYFGCYSGDSGRGNTFFAINNGFITQGDFNVHNKYQN